MQNPTMSSVANLARGRGFTGTNGSPRAALGVFRSLLPTVGIVALLVASLSSALTGFALALPRPPIAPSVVDHRSITVAEQLLALSYLRAYVRGDAPAADGLASPLNRLEWTRRGLAADGRRTSLAPTATTEPAAEPIHFSYVGGIRDARGFGHLLYTGQPVNRGQATIPSAWRVDTDLNGRVIWAELVFLFSENATSLTPVLAGDDAASIPLPEDVAKLHPRLIAGVRASHGQEGYYLITASSATAPSAVTAAPDAVLFVGIDADGLARPGAWSYGQENPGSSRYGQAPAIHPVATDPELAALLTSYFEAL